MMKTVSQSSRKWRSSWNSFTNKKKANPPESTEKTVSRGRHDAHDDASFGSREDGDGPYRTDSPRINDNGTMPDWEDSVPIFHRWTTWLGALKCLFATDRAHFPIGLLDVDIIEAFGLPASDMCLTSDPYCVATLTGYWSHGQEWPESMRAVLQTSTKTQTLNPKWEAHVKFYVPRAGAVLRLEVFDEDTIDNDDPLGFVEVPLESLLDSNRIRAWLRIKLAQPFAGKLKKIRRAHLKDPFDRNSDSDASASFDDEDPLLEGESNDAADRPQNEPPSSNPKRSLFAKYLGPLSKGARLGKHAALLVELKFDYAPLGDALTGLLWPEDPYEYHDSVFTLDKTLTEIFKTLRLIQPVIDFFTAADETGLLDEWYWTKNGRSPSIAALPRSGFWLVFLAALFKKWPWAIWSFVQAYVVAISLRQLKKRKANIIQYRQGRALKRLLKVGPDDPVPVHLAKEAQLTRVYVNGAPQEVAVLEAQERAKSSEDAQKAKEREDEAANASVLPAENYVDVAREMSSSLINLTEQIDAALSAPLPEPAFWGRPPNHWSEEPFNDAVPVFYDSDDEQEQFVNWIPEDHYIDCRFEQDGMVGELVDRLLSMLRAPWMDKVQNVLLKVNTHLDLLHSFLDWRNPAKCRLFALAVGLSAVVHLFVPFSSFLFGLNAFLFVYWTPVYEYGVKLLSLPVTLPRRLRHTKTLRMSPPASNLVDCQEDGDFADSKDTEGEESTGAVPMLDSKNHGPPQQRGLGQEAAQRVHPLRKLRSSDETMLEMKAKTDNRKGSTQKADSPTNEEASVSREKSLPLGRAE